MNIKKSTRKVDFLELKLSQFFAELTAAENMKVEVVNGLASIGAAVGNNAVTVANACAGGDQGNVFKNVSNFSTGFFRDIFNGVHVHFRNDKNVDGGLGIQILESENLVIFVNLGRGDESCCDFTKNTILHGNSPFVL